MRQYSWGEDQQVTGPQNYFRLRLIIHYLQSCTRNGIILDAGCGGGELMFLLRDQGYHVSGVDTAPGNVNAVKAGISENKLGITMDVRNASITKLPFKKNEFGGVVCGEVLEHITNDQKAVKELLRVLKPGGICVVTVPAFPELWNPLDDISGHQRRYTPQSLRGLFEPEQVRILTVFTWGVPLSNFWQKYVFLPYLKKSMGRSPTKFDYRKKSKGILQNRLLRRILSYAFYIDILFRNVGKGSFMMLVAQKEHE